MDRQARIRTILDHYDNPRHWGTLQDADVRMPGGNPGCGDIVTIYLRFAEDRQRIARASYEAVGCTISVAASSMVLEQVVDGDLTMDEVLMLDYEELLDRLGRQIVASRPRCATLGLGTLKAAVRHHRRDELLASIGDGSRTEKPSNSPMGLVFGPDAAEAARNITVYDAEDLSELPPMGSVHIRVKRGEEARDR